MLGLGLAADSEKKGFDNNETKNNKFFLHLKRDKCLFEVRRTVRKGKQNQS